MLNPLTPCPIIPQPPDPPEPLHLQGCPGTRSTWRPWWGRTPCRSAPDETRQLTISCSGVPWNTLNLATLVGQNPSWTLRSSTLSEFGTEQLEAIVLSHLTGNATFAERAEGVIAMLARKFPGQASCRFACCGLRLGSDGHAHIHCWKLHHDRGIIMLAWYSPSQASCRFACCGLGLGSDGHPHMCYWKLHPMGPIAMLAQKQPCQACRAYVPWPLA